MNFRVCGIVWKFDRAKMTSILINKSSGYNECGEMNILVCIEWMHRIIMPNKFCKYFFSLLLYFYFWPATCCIAYVLRKYCMTQSSTDQQHKRYFDNIYVRCCFANSYTAVDAVYYCTQGDSAE